MKSEVAIIEINGCNNNRVNEKNICFTDLENYNVIFNR